MRHEFLIAAIAMVGSALLGSVGCSGEGPAGPSPQKGAPASVFNVTLVETNASLLPACNLRTSGETAFVTSSSSLVTCVTGLWVPIACTVTLGGDVAYDSAQASLWACTASLDGGLPQWQPITLPQGPVGPIGPRGPQGDAGPPGTPAAQVNVVAVPPGAACVGGGEEIEIGTATDADGGDGGFQVQQTAFVCNGSSNPSAGVGPCTADGDCNDGNPCTTDACVSGTCGHTLATKTTVCRPPAGPCDKPELCTGTSPVCPDDVYEAENFICEATPGPCQLAARCTGTSTLCPTPVVEPSGHVCKAATGCALASTCDGSTPTCPAQQPAPAGAACTATACSTAAACDGTSMTCPASASVADGTSCTATTSGPAFCSGGSCVAGCDIGGTIYGSFENNGPCQQCDPETSATSWTPLTGSSCGSLCSGNAVAQAVCGGSDGVTCVADPEGQFETCVGGVCETGPFSSTFAFCSCGTSADCQSGYVCGGNQCAQSSL